jgi:hypothetical protein
MVCVELLAISLNVPESIHKWHFEDLNEVIKEQSHGNRHDGKSPI